MPMPKGQWHWLEVKGTGGLANVCRTTDVYNFPDEAESRQDKRLSLQKDLLSYETRDKSFKDILRDIPRLYAWLTFRIGHDGRVSHLCWASPAVDTNTWLAHINVVEQIAKTGTTPAPASPTPDPKDKLKLKDHIAQALEKVDDAARGS